MKRIIALLLAMLIVLPVCAFAEYRAELTQTELSGRLEGLVIGIDPGHQAKGNNGKELVSPNGKEKKAKVASGTSGYSTRIPEYKTVLEISLVLRDVLEAEGATVIMTRETNDVDISNYERAMLMNDANADLVLRIHCNGSTDHSVHGAGMYVRSTCAYSKKVVANPSALLDAERKAAAVLLESLCASTGCKGNGVYRRDSYTMNNWSTVPIILCELGYSTNKTEDENLNDPAYQLKIANGLTEGICTYFGR